MIKLIACIDNNKAIGKDGKLLYHLAEDMQNFKKLTKGDGNNAVVMGRKTYESLPNGQLKGRTNIVLTKDKEWKDRNEKYVYEPSPLGGNKLSSESLFVLHGDTLAFLTELDGFCNCKDFWIIGGGQVYKEAIEKGYPEMLYITKVNRITKDADTFFPDFEDKYELVEKSEVHDNGKYEYTFNVYKRKG